MEKTNYAYMYMIIYSQNSWWVGINLNSVGDHQECGILAEDGK